MNCGLYEGIPVYIGYFLPMAEMTTACDLETKEEIQVETGGTIDIIKFQGNIYVSKAIFDNLEKIKP